MISEAGMEDLAGDRERDGGEYVSLAHEVCQRIHLQDASLSDLLGTINKASQLPYDTPWGKMNVFRQYIPRYEAVEYTVFFWQDGRKWRLDETVYVEELDAHREDQETWVRELIYDKIRAGKANPVGNLK